MAFDKVRIRFRKAGDLRLVSHHDVMRCFERILRRASLPFRSTEGFHPMPRLVFSLSLPLGMVGLSEVVELELTEIIEPEDVLSRLREQTPPGFDFLSASRIPLKTTARPRQAIYHLPLSRPDAEWLPERCVRLWSQSEIWLDRIRPTPKQINIRPYLNDLRCENQSLRIDLWLSQEGSARADEVVRALGLQSRLDEGDYLTRTDLILLDEMSPEAIALLPELPTAASRATFERPLVGALPELEPATASSEWGASPNGPVVE